MQLSKKTIIMVAAIIMILAPTALNVLARPSGMGIGKEWGHKRPLVEPILIGHGFALKGEEVHILDVTAIKMSNASSDFIRSLIWKHKNPQEITDAINNAQTSTKIRGHLRFAGKEYGLNITGYDNQSITGDVLTIPPPNQKDSIPAPAGHIELSLSKYEGEVLSTGTLKMNNTDYKVLLASPGIAKKW